MTHCHLAIPPCPVRAAALPGRRAAALATALCLAAAFPAAAGTFGSLANFDAVNDTGKPAYGFEIEIEDPLFDRSHISSVFGYDRVFSFISNDPGAVVRYGRPEISEPRAGVVLIRYGGAVGPVATPAGSFSNPGDSCWPGSAQWSLAAACDHYGVSTYGTPARTTYYWLVEGAAPGSVVRQSASLPAVQFAYTPPAGAAPARVMAAIDAVAPDAEQPDNAARWGAAFWVKSYTTKVQQNIDLGNLLRGDEQAERAEIETEWSLLQRPPAGGDGANERLDSPEIDLGDADKAVIRRYEFYRYTGLVNPEDGEARCNGGCENDPHGLLAGSGHLGVDYVGDYVGQQIAGFNAVQAIPEPASAALLLAGIGGLAAWIRRQRMHGRPAA